MNPDGLIHPTPRMSHAGAVIVSSIVLIYSLAAFSPVLRPAAAFAALFVLLIAFVKKEPEAALPAMLILLVIAAPLLHPLLRQWPWALLVPVLVFLALTLPFPGVRSRLHWFRRGNIDGTSALLIAATILASGSALFWWERLVEPDLSLHLSFFPAMSPWFVPLAALGFSAGNAALEEFMFRGAVMHATDSAYGPGWGSLLVQAWLFGAVHFLKGFPNGWWGFALAALYGVMLGLLRRRSNGLLAPWTAHVGADLVIFLILMTRVVR